MEGIEVGTYMLVVYQLECGPAPRLVYFENLYFAAPAGGVVKLAFSFFCIYIIAVGIDTSLTTLLVLDRVA